MTKEKLMTIVNERGLLEVDDLNKFFNSNVVIPKGTNRHHYADVLHQAVEGIEIEATQKHNNLWKPSGLIASEQLKYRIKPSEPVYEWLFYDSCCGEPRISQWLTKTEAHQYNWDNCIEETKRIRQ